MNNEKNSSGSKNRNSENEIRKNGETIYNYGSDSSYGIEREVRGNRTQQNPGGYSAINYEPETEKAHVPEGVKRLFIRVGLILAMVCVFFVIKAMNDGEDTSEPESFTQSTPVYDENFYEDWREENPTLAAMVEAQARESLSYVQQDSNQQNTIHSDANKEENSDLEEIETNVSEMDNEAENEVSEIEDISAEAVDADIDEIEVLTFRNERLLEQHYDKHGIEMGFASAEEYEEAAFAVVCNPDALHKIEQEDGDHVYYVEETNEFVVVSTDGYIRTYFYPNAGIDYFNRQ